MKRFIPVLVLPVVVCAFWLGTQTSPTRITRAEAFAREIPMIPEIADDPDEQTAMEFLIARDPVTHRIPEKIREREQKFAASLPSASRAAGIGGGTLVWQERGPNNVGGRTRVFAIDVADPNTLIAGSVAGGIWKSTNDGASWMITTDPEQIHTTTCIAQDRRQGHTDTWYVGTGEFVGSTNNNTRWGSLYRGDGIFKSTDNGSTWHLLPSTTSGTPQTSDPFDYIWSVATDPANPVQDIVYAATYVGVYRSTNGGDTWTLSLAADPSYALVTVSPAGVVYASINSNGIPSVYRSPDGVAWTNITPTAFSTANGRILLTPCPSSPDIVYCFVQNANTPPSTAGHQIWKYRYLSGDGSRTGGAWENRSASLPGDINTQGGYDMVLDVKPVDTNFVIIGGTNLYRSTDGFASPGNVTVIGGYPYYPDQFHHPDIHNGGFRPGTPSVYYSSHDGGISRCDDIDNAQVTWVTLNHGYNVTQFYSVSIDPDSGSNVIMAGAQDNGTVLGNAPGASDWIPVFGGDGTVVKVAPGSHDRLYIQYQNGQMYRESRAVTDFVYMTPSGATNMLFVNPLILDPNSPRIMYFPAGRNSPALTSAIWRNDNAPDGDNVTGWTPLDGTDVGPAAGYSRRISALGVSTTNVPNVLYFGTIDGIVRRADNVDTPTPTVTTITPPGLGGGTSTGGFVRAIAVDPQYAANALLAFGNYNFQSLWHTTNSGASWTDVEGNLSGPSGPSVRWASIFYVDGVRQIFLGTSIGVLFTPVLNGGSTVWTREGESTVGNVLIAMLDYRPADKTLAVGTHARGVFTATFEGPLGVEDAGTIAEEFRLNQNYPNPFNPATTLTFHAPHGGDRAELAICDIAGRVIATLLDGPVHAGENSVVFHADHLASGTYFARLRMGSQVAVRKMLLLR